MNFSGTSNICYAWIFHPWVSQIDTISSTSRQSFEKIRKKSETSYGQARHRIGHLYHQMVLPMFLRQSKFESYMPSEC